MTFNADKYEVLRINKKRHPISANYYIYIHNQNLAVKTDAKYLGVTISSDLSLGKHKDNITKKANSTMAFLKRNIRSASKTANDMAYKTFVRRTLDYDSSTWAPYTECDNHKIEMVQHQAVKFITSDQAHQQCRLYEVSIWSGNLQWRRELARLTMTYRIVHQLIDIPAKPYLTLSIKSRHHCRLPEQLLPENNCAVEPAPPVSCEPVNAGGLPGTAGRPHLLNATLFLTF